MIYLVIIIACISGLFSCTVRATNLLIENNYPIEFEVVFPSFPQDEQLQAFTVDNVSELRYALDKASINVNNDAVTRYTVVITSPGGARNVFYEGIRCLSGEYKTYSYGTIDKKFTAKTEVEWQPIRRNESGINRYRNALYDYYLCDKLSNSKQLNKETILRNLQDGTYLDKLRGDSSN